MTIKSMSRKPPQGAKIVKTTIRPAKDRPLKTTAEDDYPHTIDDEVPSPSLPSRQKIERVLR